ncbi:LysR family transcriptional regulator [Paraburkholderia terrae]|uniref:LysR family transcriptional regulator n=1 Tax=Paraburkholderia terrae TaxID=311230 RepID=A0ABM7U0N2_9BURK|nr:LysR family transcriptional regulator [Paraburkholderia terrae]BCZ84618.1 LysR family transcriptional regulator [Paraburkholderia terrae]BDC45867.1 LysR family transcriptional regulator [Paraburkholderia terrae]
MNLKQLETFAVVAELGSISRAAQALGVAQSLVSRNLTQLEEEWRDRLFDRTGRGVVLTEFGRRVQPEVTLLLNQAERLQLAIRESAGALTGTVHIGMLPSLAPQLLPRLFADISENAPGVKLHVAEGFSGSLDEQLGSGRLDMIVVNRYGTAQGRHEDVLGVVDTFLVGDPQHEVFGRSTIGFRRLADLRLVLPAAPNGLRAVLDHVAREQGVALNIVMEVDTLTAMKDVAASGGAFTILPELAVREELRVGRLAAARIERPAIRRTIALGFTRQRPLLKAARFVGSRVRDLATNLLAVSPG